MKKDIYIIKNIINNKVYIGQSVDSEYRFRKHKEAALRNKKYDGVSALHNAMRKYGIDKFYYEVLEHQIEDYNEKEIFWIEKYNSKIPNGYNIADGGNWYPHQSGIYYHSAAIKNEETLNYIYEELLYTKKSLTDIGKENNIDHGVIWRINNGQSYANKNFTYPLREINISKEKLKRIVYDLKNTDLSYTEICQNYGISKQSLIGINSGKRFFQDYLDYPIRRVAFSGNGANKDEVQKIKDDLISKKYKRIELAKKYNCSCNTINRINKGISYFDKNLVYPLCRFNNELEESELREIEHLLIDTNISINKIAEQFSISTATIKRINKGETKKYFNSLLKYPLRKK